MNNEVEYIIDEYNAIAHCYFLNNPPPSNNFWSFRAFYKEKQKIEQIKEIADKNLYKGERILLIASACALILMVFSDKSLVLWLSRCEKTRRKLPGLSFTQLQLMFVLKRVEAMTNTFGVNWGEKYNAIILQKYTEGFGK